MRSGKKLQWVAAVVVASVASVCSAATTPISNWVVQSGTSAVSGTPTNPTYTPGDNITVMAPFSDVTLANDGDYVNLTATLNVSTRATNTGTNALNTQLRFGIFDDNTNGGTVSASPNVGFIIEYSNVVAGGLIREQQSTVQTNPFVSPTNLGNGTQDSGADSLQGANIGPVVFNLTLTRAAGKINLSGTISGTDSVSGNPYLQNYSVAGISSANFPADGSFTFNRVGLFLGPNVDGPTASISDAFVTVPEPGAMALAGLGLSSLMLKRRRASGQCDD
jgi:hypothetical protein